MADDGHLTYGMIDKAEEIERRQWNDFEAKFRSYHEASLLDRFPPETDEEREVVVKALDYQSLHFTSWPSPIEYREIT